MSNPSDNIVMLSYDELDGYPFACSIKESLTAANINVAFFDKNRNPNVQVQKLFFNDKLPNCKFMVAFITPSYGCRGISSSEFKLADHLGIPVLPIKFVHDWPPKCLAIQLATIQFVDWSMPKKEFRKGSWWTVPDVQRITESLIKSIRNLNDSVNNPALYSVMISYVTKETSEHASLLKKALASLGKDSVYLDQDELLTGCNWQDSLNHAVSECTYFLPLVTANYGLTPWTKREAHLADHLNKKVIPVNYLKQDWPPSVLRIQYQDKDFIDWPFHENLEESIMQVARQVSDRIDMLNAIAPVE